MYNNLKIYSKYYSITIAFFAIVFLELFIINLLGDISILNSSDNAITAIFFNHLLESPVFALPLIYFATIQTLLHLVFIASTYNFYELVLNFYKDNFINKLIDSSKLKLFLYFILYATFSYVLILIINNYYYPNSIFSFTNFISNSFILSFMSSKFMFLFAVIYTGISLLIGFIRLIRPYVKHNFFILLSLLIIFIFIIFDKINLIYYKNFNADNKHPNIVLITVDSFRFDHINKINNSTNNNNYDIPSFVNNSVRFNNAYTPLARSFPALYSILSGKYPTTENIRFNLVDQKNINFTQLLPNILKQNNYETLYATDSNQFHIINKDWGYDNLVTPKQGIYEHFIPKLNDLPISNLIINSSISKYLFPYTYSNQSASRIYDPITYVHNIKASINKLNKDKSVFLHLNFEGAHWPYQNRYLDKNLRFQDRYNFSLNSVNWQISEIFNYLSEYNLLNNTVVILASDHGEALAIKDDKVINKGNFIGDKKLLKYVNKHPVNYTFAEIKDKNLLEMILDINSSGGHGVDVLSKSQYQTVVAIQKFVNTNKVYNPNIINNNIVLNDLYETILDLADINTDNNNTLNIQLGDSISLAPIIKQNNNLESKLRSSLDDRYIFLETGLQVPYFDAAELKNKDIVNNFIKIWSKHYYINNKDYLELSNKSVDELVKTKQYAVVHNNDILAYIPNGVKQNWRIEDNIENNNIKSCDIPRPVHDIDGKTLALLCGYYNSSPGYYVYYNDNVDKWTLYTSTEDFKDLKLVSRLSYMLRKHYKSEIPA